MVERLVEALGPIDPSVRAGFATFPANGTDGDTLLLAARQAVEGAGRDELASADRGVRELVMGDRPMTLIADPAMARVYELLERLARASVSLSVLILGETGVGKENAAFALHHFSERASGPFMSLNCGAFAESLLEAELFGYEKGAFTSAIGAKPGLLEAGHGGTVFLDEVAELSPSAQSRLLRALETKTVMRVGSVKERVLDIRVVAATHRDLREEVAAGRFRQDLYYRLNGGQVQLPPLRDRPREIALLARRFVEEASRVARRAPPVLSARAMALLAGYAWPGNVRQLKHAMEFAVATTTGAVLEPWDLPAELAGDIRPTPPAAYPQVSERLATFASLGQEVRELERRRILEALEATDGNQTRAAALIGMPRRTFVLRLRELRLGEGRN
jgi:DNA-binding NtrC family response regulator